MKSHKFHVIEVLSIPNDMTYIVNECTHRITYTLYTSIQIHVMQASSYDIICHSKKNLLFAITCVAWKYN